MKIPPWAENALQSVRPKPPASSGPDGRPDAQALAHWAQYTGRFRDYWYRLDAPSWKVPSGPNGDQASTAILLAALECARRLGVDDHPERVISARKELLTVEDQIAEAAQKLAALFRQRDQLQKQYGVARWRDRDVDPIDLWDALELSFEGPREDPARVFASNANIGKAIRLQLDQARAAQRSAVPQWGDLLQQLGNRFEFGHSAGEFPEASASAGDTNKSRYSPWCKSLIQMLHEWSVLECVPNTQLAGLASVAFDSPVEDINPSQIGALRRAFMRRQAPAA